MFPHPQDYFSPDDASLGEQTHFLRKKVFLNWWLVGVPRDSDAGSLIQDKPVEYIIKVLTGVMSAKALSNFVWKSHLVSFHPARSWRRTRILVHFIVVGKTSIDFEYMTRQNLLVACMKSGGWCMKVPTLSESGRHPYRMIASEIPFSVSFSRNSTAYSLGPKMGGSLWRKRNHNFSAHGPAHPTIRTRRFLSSKGSRK